MSAAIFISYRREDTTPQARMIADWLSREFGKDCVFMDLQSVKYTEDFVLRLDEQLAQCQVMLVLIGPNWLETSDNGTRWPERKDNFARLEICTALASPNVRVLPVLLDAKMPSEDELPPAMRQLARRHGMPFRFGSFDADIQHLITSLREIVNCPDVPPPLPEWANADGDDGLGHWADIRVDNVVQRLRWIRRGEFTMGSPDDELDRSADEGPQHRVRLSHGFWLADTACTQGLWSTVMHAKNPAYFHGNSENPVEQVSHDDALRFLTQLGKRLGFSANPLLPTEAQWEYACRAGTTTPFSFGHQISTNQVNHNGNHPYGAGPTGGFRKRTVPVKSLPSNPFGLFEMHGNVWEWCADGAGRNYAHALANGIVNDPIELAADAPGALRALRGGSWNDGACGVRAACRLNFPRAFLNRFVGFRVAFGSTL